MRRAFTPVLGFVTLLWAVMLAQRASGVSLASSGVFPRRLDGLDGVLWAPLIHGSWAHLIGNSGALLVLGTALLYGYPRSARIVLPALYAGPGLAVWLLGRPAFHVGASGLAFGLLFFVFTVGVLRWDRRAIALAMVVSFLYGSMVWGVLPHDPEISFESHLAGAIIGIALAFALRWRDPPPPRRRYSWEDEDSQDGDSTGGDSGDGVRHGAGNGVGDDAYGADPQDDSPRGESSPGGGAGARTGA